MHRTQRAFTLIELMIALAVLGLVLGFVINSFSAMLTRQRLQGAAESLYDTLLLARTESISRNTNVYVNVTTGSSWCYGIDDTASCSCSTANDCQINSVTKVTESGDFRGVSVSSAGLSFRYDSRRGLPDTTDGTAFGERTFTFSANNDHDHLSVKINPVGRVKMCTDSGFRGYSAC